MKIVSKSKPKRCSHCHCELPNDIQKIIECTESKDRCTFYEDIQYYNRNGDFSPDFLRAIEESINNSSNSSQVSTTDIQTIQQIKRDLTSKISRLEHDKQNLQNQLNNYNTKIYNLKKQIDDKERQIRNKRNKTNELDERFSISLVVLIIGGILALINLFYANWFCRIVIPIDVIVWVVLMSIDEARETVIEWFE